MRRRKPTAGLIPLEPFEAPDGDVFEVWAAYEAWETALDAYLLAHPEKEMLVDDVRARSTVPDAPFDPSTI